MKFLKSKEALILTAALVVPGGLVALGLWKAYELYRKKERDEERDSKEKEPVATNQSFIDSLRADAESDRIHSGKQGD